MKKMLFSALFLAFAVSASAQTTQYAPGVNAEGVTYFLPVTKLDVRITAVRTVYTPGEFARYAERYLRLSGISDVPAESWEITDVNITPFGYPDPENAYTVKFDKKSIAPYIELTPDGILSAINIQTEETDASLPQKTEKADARPQTYMTEEILMAGSTAKMAELAAKEIYSIRESRNAITRGQADYIPKDGESLKYMLQQLDEQERQLMLLFTGETSEEEHNFTVTVFPQTDVRKQILVRLSNKLGVVGADNLAGSPVWFDLTDLHSVPQPVETGKKKASASTLKGPGVIWYRVPGKASVKIYDNRNTYLETTVQIAQFGNIEPLTGNILNKAFNTSIVFDTATGNVKHISE